jgi:hypothetical protein
LQAKACSTKSEREAQHKLDAPVPQRILAAAGEDLAEVWRTQIRDRSGFVHRVEQVLELDVRVQRVTLAGTLVAAASATTTTAAASAAAEATAATITTTPEVATASTTTAVIATALVEISVPSLVLVISADAFSETPRASNSKIEAEVSIGRQVIAWNDRRPAGGVSNGVVVELVSLESDEVSWAAPRIIGRGERRARIQLTTAIDVLTESDIQRRRRAVVEVRRQRDPQRRRDAAAHLELLAAIKLRPAVILGEIVGVCREAPTAIAAVSVAVRRTHHVVAEQIQLIVNLHAWRDAEL